MLKKHFKTIIMNKTFGRTDPDGADEYFLEAIRNGDIKIAISCFGNEAVYIGADGKTTSGLDNIEKIVTGLCKMKPDIKVYDRQMAQWEMI